MSPKGSAPTSKAAQAAIARQQTKTTGTSIGSAIRSSASSASDMLKGQGSIRSYLQSQPTSSTSAAGLSEDEALARALQESMNEQRGATSSNTSSNQVTAEAPRTVEEQDLMLAQALAESQREASSQRTAAGNGDKSCTIC